jgi:threonine dehydrogenase-like Zn-dependent dehydrogenase
MRTAVISNPLRAEVSDTPIPAALAGELLVKLQGCGVCGSNIPVWEGRPWFRYPLDAGAPGHEGWGIVEQIGAGVNEFSVGDRVAFISDHAYAEYDTTPAVKALRLPKALDSVPFPAEPLGCAMNVFQRSAIQAGDSVAIVGIGFMGALLTRLASDAGARVTAISRRKCALEIAEAFGAADVLCLDESSKAAALAVERTNHKGYDCVIEAVGRQETLDLATELTKERGRLVIAGFHQDGPRQVNLQLWNWRGLDVINAHERDSRIYLRGMQAAVDAVLEGSLDPSPLYTHLFPLENISEALDMAKTRPDGFVKALVML